MNIKVVNSIDAVGILWRWIPRPQPSVFTPSVSPLISPSPSNSSSPVVCLIYSIPGLCDSSEIYLHGCCLKLNLHTVRYEYLITTIFLTERIVFRHTCSLISLSFWSLLFLQMHPFYLIKDLFWTIPPFSKHSVPHFKGSLVNSLKSIFPHLSSLQTQIHQTLPCKLAHKQRHIPRVALSINCSAFGRVEWSNAYTSDLPLAQGIPLSLSSPETQVSVARLTKGAGQNWVECIASFPTLLRNL